MLIFLVALETIRRSKIDTASIEEEGKHVMGLAEAKGDNTQQYGKPEQERPCVVNIDYESEMRTAFQFLTVFPKKFGSKSEDVDYRVLFENFLQDQLTTVSAPEWPAAQLLLFQLGKLLMSKFAKKGTEEARKNMTVLGKKRKKGVRPDRLLDMNRTGNFDSTERGEKKVG